MGFRQSSKDVNHHQCIMQRLKGLFDLGALGKGTSSLPGKPGYDSLFFCPGTAQAFLTACQVIKEVKFCKGQQSTLNQRICFFKVRLHQSGGKQTSMVENNLCFLSL